MNNEEFLCARPGCGKWSPRKTHNQKYCTDECCRIATNAKIMERYYEAKERRSGKPRQCKSCGNWLSRYNHGDLCSGCSTASTIESMARAGRFLDNVIEFDTLTI